ncbi:MAG TPA: hypothetical protein VEJ36_04950 [Nitrososphaerales archaeon]|nr:hypothetical protein [Nitrososphaerales archaeon]
MTDGPTDEERAQFKRVMNEMVQSRLEMFKANAPKFADALGTFRDALKSAGFSEEESMQIVLKVAESPGGPFFRRGFGRRHKE